MVTSERIKYAYSVGYRISKLGEIINQYPIKINSEGSATNFAESRIRIATEAEIEKICRENKRFRLAREARARIGPYM